MTVLQTSITDSLPVLPTSVTDSLSVIKVDLSAFTGATGMNAELLGAIGMPFIILLFCSLAKNVVAVGFKDIKWFDFFAEMAIDLLTIFGTFVIGRYFLITSSQAVLMSSSEKVGIIAIAILIVSVCRRAAHHLMQKSKPSYVGAGSMLFLEFLFDVLCFIVVFKV